jgi:hypothetical protein
MAEVADHRCPICHASTPGDLHQRICANVWQDLIDRLLNLVDPELRHQPHDLRGRRTSSTGSNRLRRRRLSRWLLLWHCHRAARQRQQEQVGAAWAETGLVFIEPNAGALDPT